MGGGTRKRCGTGLACRRLVWVDALQSLLRIGGLSMDGGCYSEIRGHQRGYGGSWNPLPKGRGSPGEVGLEVRV